MSIQLIFGAAAILTASGIPGLFMDRRSSAGQIASAAMTTLGGALGLCGVWLGLAAGESVSLDLPWFIPWGRFAVKLDAISAVFMVPVFLIPTLGSIYGLGYWKQADHPGNGRKLRLFSGLLAASMAMTLMARDGVLFLIAWEIMAVSAYFLATTEDEDPEVCRSGWIYLVATHLGTLCLIAMFALLRRATGSFALEPIGGALDADIAAAIFLLAAAGFGIKAGIMPLHVWLPGAHANAPSHVSAVMSGVMLKMGIYGIVRIVGLLPAPPEWWGGLLLALGAISGILGIVLAIGQRDLKRLLAYSSVENIGIIVMGLGLATLGRSLRRPDWIALGLGGALLHVWNHSLFKSLLFLNAGAVIHAVHTREIDRMGGLAKTMPRAAALFVVGAVAICGLPPLNGFVGELLIYVGLFRTFGAGEGASWPAAAFAAPALAMIGALAIACFVKLLGAVFLGQPRSECAPQAREAPATMTGPIAALAGGCCLMGMAPWLAAPLMDRAAAAWKPADLPAAPIGDVVPLEWITISGLALLTLAALVAVAAGILIRGKSLGSVPTWDCGYAKPTARMQYSGSSFSQLLTDLFSWALWPNADTPPMAGLFPKPARFKTDIPDPALDRLALPALGFAARFLPWLKSLLRGRIQADIFYVFLIAIVLFFWR